MQTYPIFAFWYGIFSLSSRIANIIFLPIFYLIQSPNIHLNFNSVSIRIHREIKQKFTNLYQNRKKTCTASYPISSFDEIDFKRWWSNTIRRREGIAGANTSSHLDDLRERWTCQAGNGPIEQTRAASKSGVARPWNGQSLLEKPPHHASVHSLSVLPRSNASAHPVCFLEESYILGNQPSQLFRKRCSDPRRS